jgi:uncharacterized membrane-anchored protein
MIGPMGIVKNISFISKKISKIQSGYIYHYVLTIILSIFFFMLIFILPNFLTGNILVILSSFYVFLSLREDFLKEKNIVKNNKE